MDFVSEPIAASRAWHDAQPPCFNITNSINLDLFHCLKLKAQVSAVRCMPLSGAPRLGDRIPDLRSRLSKGSFIHWMHSSGLTTSPASMTFVCCGGIQLNMTTL